MIPAHLAMLTAAIITVEGAHPGHRDGPMQITPILLADYNAHVGHRQALTARECKRIGPSTIVFRWYVQRYCDDTGSAYVIAARWNAGPDGDRQAHTSARIADYANRVETLYLDRVKADLAKGRKLLGDR